MDENELVIARWHANARAAGIDLPDTIVATHVNAGAINQIIALEALLRRLDPGFVMPDALARPWDSGDDND